MDKIRVLTLIGGISKNSLNKKLYRAIQEEAGGDFELHTYNISRIPYFSQDLEPEPPDSVIKFKDLIREADAVLFITPEYNRSFPGVLKNALDWGSRPYSQNLWDKKPAGVLGATTSLVGTFGAQHHLRQVLSYLNMSVMGQPEFYFTSKNSFDEDGKLIDEEARKKIRQYMEAFRSWIERVGEHKFSPPPLQPSKGLEDSPYTTH